MANITFNFASGLNDSIFGKSQAPIKMFLEKKGEAFEQKSMINEIFNVDQDTSWGVKLSTMTAMEGFKPVGELGHHPVDGSQEGFSKTIEHMVWKDRFSISREAVDDAKVIDLKKRPAQFITGYYRTRERFAAALMGAAIQKMNAANVAGVSFDTTAADKKCLFATDHPSVLAKSRTQTNQFADALSKDALAAMETEMQNFKGDNNEILDVVPDTILIPNDFELKMQLFEILGATKDPETAGGNGFNYLFGRWNVIVWPYLNQFIKAGTKPYIMLASEYNKDYGGAVWYDRKELEMTSWIDHDTNANVWDGYARFGAGFNDWRAFAVGGVDGGTTLVG